MTSLNYYRCQDCLTIGTHEELFNAAECVACDGRFVHLGRTQKDHKRLVKDALVSVCDARCTNATGPHCNCMCACANHGSGRVVKVIRDAGRLPKFEASHVSASASKMVALEYRTLKQMLRDALREWSKSQTSHKAWMEDYYVNNTLAKATKSTNHKNRVKVLVEHIEKLTGETVDVAAITAAGEDYDWRPMEILPEDFFAA